MTNTTELSARAKELLDSDSTHSEKVASAATFTPDPSNAREPKRRAA